MCIAQVALSTSKYLVTDAPYNSVKEDEPKGDCLGKKYSRFKEQNMYVYPIKVVPNSKVIPAPRIADNSNHYL